jgi:hypothetical protein
VHETSACVSFAEAVFRLVFRLLEAMTRVTRLSLSPARGERQAGASPESRVHQTWERPKSLSLPPPLSLSLFSSRQEVEDAWAHVETASCFVHRGDAATLCRGCYIHRMLHPSRIHHASIMHPSCIHHASMHPCIHASVSIASGWVSTASHDS